MYRCFKKYRSSIFDGKRLKIVDDVIRLCQNASNGNSLNFVNNCDKERI